MLPHLNPDQTIEKDRANRDGLILVTVNLIAYPADAYAPPEAWSAPEAYAPHQRVPGSLYMQALIGAFSHEPTPAELGFCGRDLSSSVLPVIDAHIEARYRARILGIDVIRAGEPIHPTITYPDSQPVLIDGTTTIWTRLLAETPYW